MDAEIAPEHLHWHTGDGGDLLSAPDISTQPVKDADAAGRRVPKAFLELAGAVLCHRHPQRHALLYRMLWRLTHGEPALLAIQTDPDTRRAADLARAVSRDCHKMKAFVRFRIVPAADERYIAWFEPEHHIVDRVAPFFARRFNGMDWTLVTPERSVRWNGDILQFGPGGNRQDAPADDDAEPLWQVYFAHIFNPARLNPRLMQKEMPRRYWKNLPEAQQIPTLMRDADARVRAMLEREAQAPRRRLPRRAD
ncbi:hypothetical protein B1808_12525 [Pseudofulvimonas gallinarii]|nr:hypothetical protein B1808_12525 [Pseudofulvimonas gallinarii]